MFGNFLEETCTGTGATLALAGVTVTNRPTFANRFADGDEVAYIVEDSGGSILVGGVGLYVSATDDITRNDTWSFNTTFNLDPDQANITLSGGTHTIRCDVSDNQLSAVRCDYFNLRAANQFISDAFAAGSGTTRTGLANRLWINGFSVVAPITLASLGIDITALSASNGDMEIGIYTVDYSTNNLTLLDKTGTIDTSTATGSTGFNTSALAGGDLTLFPNTPYFIVVGSDGSATMSGISWDRQGHPFLPQLDDGKAVGMFNSGWSSGLPTTITGLTHNNGQTSGVYPNAFGVKA